MGKALCCPRKDLEPERERKRAPLLLTVVRLQICARKLDDDTYLGDRCPLFLVPRVKADDMRVAQGEEDLDLFELCVVLRESSVSVGGLSFILHDLNSNISPPLYPL